MLMILQTMGLIAEEVEDFANHGVSCPRSCFLQTMELIAEEIDGFANNGVNC